MPPPDPHLEFQELCALSTTGELTDEEWRRLKEHLAQCEPCRSVLRDYERVVVNAIPVLGDEDEYSSYAESPPSGWSLEEAEARLMAALRDEPHVPAKSPTIVRTSRQLLKPLALAASLLAAVGVGGYLVGLHHQGTANPTGGHDVGSVTHESVRTTQAAREISNQRILSSNPSDIAMRDRLPPDHEEVEGLKKKIAELEGELAKRNADIENSLLERTELEKRLGKAEASAQNLEARLNLVRSTTSRDGAEFALLKAQIKDLNVALDQKNEQISREQALLERDHDIRNLISARNLYIAEIYDVAKTGETQKPFGRVFYTQGTSLVFYGYDLDQQGGQAQTRAFQAWGRRGTDPKGAVSLGLLYQDDAAQRRWILKCDDPKTVASIDAVFVTVEPKGGSTKPSGKPLLFTYLRLSPNHP